MIIKTIRGNGVFVKSDAFRKALLSNEIKMDESFKEKMKIDEEIELLQVQYSEIIRGFKRSFEVSYKSYDVFEWMPNVDELHRINVELQEKAMLLYRDLETITNKINTLKEEFNKLEGLK